jgi:ABC-type lipoprotein export system ATPase subunit/bifunctional DNA-binding transcriptional regulator/antitoxin component of YhaV-PrlF toxin-antitoxin module
MAHEPFILCDNLVKIYRVVDHDVVALQGLDLVVEPGELLGIVGVSGSGKTTLMNILGGLDRPSAGRVWVDGKDLLKMSVIEMDYYRRNTVGFLWQQSSRNLISHLSARKNVEMPLILSGENSGYRRKQADHLLDAVGLADRRRHRLAELSGGEQQRVAIAVALANNPKLLLADEPTGEVDETTAQTIYQTIHDLNREFNLTTLIVSHDPNLAHHVDRVIAIRDGKVSTETVRQSEVNFASDVPNQLGDQERAGKVFRELTVLDSAGRLQVPKEYLDRFNINGRVQLEPTEVGILIVPVPDADQTRDTESVLTNLVQRKKLVGWQRWIGRLISHRKGDRDLQQQ